MRLEQNTFFRISLRKMLFGLSSRYGISVVNPRKTIRSEDRFQRPLVKRSPYPSPVGNSRKTIYLPLYVDKEVTVGFQGQTKQY